MGNNINLQLTSSEHGIDDFDVTGHEDIHRVCVGHGIKNGDVFNVYGPESTKRGATWRGSVENSLSSFLVVDVDSVHVSRELKRTHEAYKGNALTGAGEASCESTGPSYVVKDEHTLGYLYGNSSFMGVLAGSVIKGGHDWKNGPVAILPGHTKLRRATVADFEAFRVRVPPDFDGGPIDEMRDEEGNTAVLPSPQTPVTKPAGMRP